MDLEKFGLPEDEKSLSGADITLKDLKDAVQLSLVQQSEYLRRFALAFSDKVREEGQEMDRDGLLKQVGMLLKLPNQLTSANGYHIIHHVLCPAEDLQHFCHVLEHY